MRDINSIFLELKYEIAKIELANAVLDSVLFLFFLNIFNLFLDISIGYFVLLAILFFTLNFLIRVKNIDLRDIEKKNPEVRDILRTANDYREYFKKGNKAPVKDVLVEGLYNDFSYLMKRVKTATFIDINLFFKKGAVAIVMAFLLVFASFFSIDVSDFLSDVDKRVSDSYVLKNADVIEDDALATYNDLFGEESEVINLDEGQFDISVSGQQLEMDISKKSGFKLEQFEGYEEFYDESAIEADQQFTEEISLTDRELVKAYFSN